MKLIAATCSFAVVLASVVGFRAHTREEAPSYPGYGDFLKIEAKLLAAAPAPSASSSPAPASSPDPSSPDAPEDPDCGAGCRDLRTEFRYVVYVGKQVYCYWDEKKADTGADFDALASKLEHSITDETTDTDYFKVLRRWAASFHDGHVNALPRQDLSDIATYSAPVRTELLAPGTDHEKLVVVTAPTGPTPGDFAPTTAIQPGDEITSVDGVPVAEAIDARTLDASGSTPRMRRWAAGRKLVDALGPVDGAKPLQLNLLRDGMPSSVTLYRVVPLSTHPTDAPTTEPTGIDLIRAAVLPGEIGYLRIDGFDGTQDQHLLDEAMDRLVTTRGLILDLRRNGGGDQSGDAILSRLATNAITRYQASERMADFTMAARPEMFMLQWTPGTLFADWHALTVTTAIPARRYDGKPAVALTSANCFSACDTFASALKVNQLATIMGEATGGGTGTPLVFDLPVSHHRFRYSTTRGRTATGGAIEGVGTQPDYVLEPTPADRATSNDSQLTRALQFLATKLGDPAPAVGPGLVEPSWKQSLSVSPTEEENAMLDRISGIDERP
jgi:C-terminal processing protease CtpA/Prc